MGVDAVITADAGRELSYYELRRLEDEASEALRVPGVVIKLIADWDDRRATDGSPWQYRIDTGLRYYGPHYERGPWPLLWGAIQWAKIRIGTVRYFGDADSSAPGPLTDEDCAALTLYWAQHGGRPYADRFRGAK